MGARAVGNPRRGLNAPARGLRTLHAAVWRALLPGRPCLQVAWSNQLDSKPPKSHSCPYKAPPRLPNSHVLHERDGCWISLCSCHKSAQSVVARYRPRVVQGLKANSFQSLSCRIRAPNEFILCFCFAGEWRCGAWVDFIMSSLNRCLANCFREHSRVSAQVEARRRRPECGRRPRIVARMASGE